jgi:hypothetical protein
MGNAPSSTDAAPRMQAESAATRSISKTMPRPYQHHEAIVGSNPGHGSVMEASSAAILARHAGALNSRP